MRAMLPLLAAALASAAPPPAPPRPAPPSLLVLRAGCALGEQAFTRPDAAGLPPAARLLGYGDTCGPGWGSSVTRGALGALARGEAVLFAGWPGADACDATEAATRALRLPPPCACSGPALAGAAAAWLAVALRAPRVAVAPPAKGPPSACGAALRRSSAELRAAGLAVRDAPLGRDDPVVILCATGSLRPRVVAGGRGPIAVLVRVDDEDGASPDDDAAPTDGEVAYRRAFLITETERVDEAAFDTRAAVARAVDCEAAALRAPSNSTEGEFHVYEMSGESRSRVAVLGVSSARGPDGAATIGARVELRNASMKFVDRIADDEDAGRSWPQWAWGACALAFGSASALLLFASLVARSRRRPRTRGGVAVLARADFSFPAEEGRGPRVGEGMETMLSCWLQQLHEFGGPQPARPDLLQRPQPPSAPSSTCSVNRLAADRRVRYKGDVVHLKCLPAAGNPELRRKATDLLIVMQNLRHENLNPFIGWLGEGAAGGGAALAWEACGRGSLEDVLRADAIALDWTFRLSLLTDLVRAMRYLHASPLRAHGRLSSRNCVVDSRWVLRVTDYGLPAFYRAQGLPQPERTARDLLWTAPELLRESRGDIGGSQPGDVFSFAIIMQEVIVRGEPYCMLALTPEEIVEKLSRPPPLIRPSVSMGAAPPEAVSVMRQCWSEAPDLRPDFHRLYDIFRHLHRGRKINIVDSMFEMLEKYSNNLEELVKDRTDQLDMEKRKTEQLLNRMLPRSVAERLMLGTRVEPEEFEEVSIYFSDIVGFTALAARSTPVQVVDLLNDLYTTFDAAIERYKVYKVETIGDAYMVVGGLPVRARDHADSVASMALHLLHLAGRFKVRHLRDAPLLLRIGLHSGPCCAGVVGLTMPRYCLFGDTVNTASRMESTGAAWRIQVSAATAALLTAAGGYRLRSRGLTQIKGKGAMHTYWLLGKEGFDRPLPTPPPLESEDVLFEIDGENEGEASPAAAQPPSPGTSPAPVAATPDRHTAWQRSGALSADSSPPPRGACAAGRSSLSVDDHSAPYARYRCLGGARRPLRRQWSLERGDSLAAAAASDAAPREPRSAPPSPPLVLAGAGAGARVAPPRQAYRTRAERAERPP